MKEELGWEKKKDIKLSSVINPYKMNHEAHRNVA